MDYGGETKWTAADWAVPVEVMMTPGAVTAVCTVTADCARQNLWRRVC